MQQKCYLLFAGDYVEDATFCPSIRYALWEFEATARELDGYGQKIEASIHFVDAKGDYFAEYPDRVLSLGPRGGLKVSAT